MKEESSRKLMLVRRLKNNRAVLHKHQLQNTLEQGRFQSGTAF